MASTTANVTIQSNSTNSSIITVLPDSNTQTFSLVSNLTHITLLGGHIGSASYHSDSTYCNSDPKLTTAILEEFADISHCSLITQAHLTGLQDTLDYSGDNIQTINPVITRDLNSVQILGLDQNNLTQVPGESFANLDALEGIYLNDNQILSVGANAFANANKLKEIRLQNNNLTQVPANVYSNLNSLETLNLFGNKIVSLDEGAFSGLPALDNLYLQNNEITQLPDAVFAALAATDIDLSNNNLTGLPLNLLQTHINPAGITNFNIANNQLTDSNGWEITEVRSGSMMAWILN